MTGLFRDLRLALRRITKNPSSSFAAVVAMALGIGLTASMYAVLDGVLLRGLPFEESERLLHLERNNLERGIESMEVTQHDFEDWSAQQTSFEDLAGFHDGTFNLADEGVPERYNGAWISASFLDLLRIDPIEGRAFEAEDEEPGAAPVVLLGYHVWQKRYGGERGVVGRSVRINSEPVTIVGILPQGFRFPINHDLWMPLVLETGDVPRGEGATLEVFGRLRDDVSLDQAASEMTLITRRLAEEYPETNEGVGAVLQAYLEEFIGEETRLLLGVMMTAVVLVLLIACFNVTNLLLGRAAGRGRELAIRSALGSGRFHVVLQVLLDALLIAGLGAVLGVGLAHLGVTALNNALAQSVQEFWIDIYLSPATLVFTVTIALAAALVAGFFPALQASRPDLNQVLHDSSRGSSSFRLGGVGRSLVVAEVALSCALLVAAGLMVRSVLAIHDYELYFDRENLLTARLGLFENDYPEEKDWTAFYDELRERVASHPGVDIAAISTVLPTETEIGAGFTWFERPDEVYERPREMPFARLVVASPGYFDALGVDVLAGRDIAESDRAEAPRVALVNEDFARKEWPGESPIGREIDLWMGQEEEDLDPAAGRATVVGLVPNLRFADFDNADDQQAIYVPMAQQPQRFAWVIARTRSDPVAFAGTLRQAVLEVDPNLPLYFVRSMEGVLAQTMFFNNLFGVLFSIFGLVAVVLASVGLYGVMAFGVTQRTQEMGIRMALGARRSEIQGMVLKQGIGRVAVGLAIGLVLAFGLGFVLRTFLFQIDPTDVATFVSVPFLLVTVAVLACIVPAQRAAGVDPIQALRYE